MAILYVTRQGAMLHKSGNQIIVKKDGEVLQEIPIVHLDEVAIFGNGHITTPAIGYLLSQNIPVSFLSSQGTYKGKLQPPYAKDTRIRQCQYAVAADPPAVPWRVGNAGWKDAGYPLGSGRGSLRPGAVGQ